MLFLRSSPVGAKDPTESVAPMSGCECKPGRAQPSRKTVLTLERADIPGLAPGATYCRRSAASIGCASRVILDSRKRCVPQADYGAPWVPLIVIFSTSHWEQEPL